MMVPRKTPHCHPQTTIGTNQACPRCRQPLPGFDTRASVLLDLITVAADALTTAQTLMKPEGEVG